MTMDYSTNLPHCPSHWMTKPPAWLRHWLWVSLLYCIKHNELEVNEALMDCLSKTEWMQLPSSSAEDQRQLDEGRLVSWYYEERRRSSNDANVQFIQCSVVKYCQRGYESSSILRIWHWQRRSNSRMQTEVITAVLLLLPGACVNFPLTSSMFMLSEMMPPAVLKVTIYFCLQFGVEFDRPHLHARFSDGDHH